MTDQKKKCTRCKVLYPLDGFKMKRNGDYGKNCRNCLIYRKKQRERLKCEHGREKSHCRDCHGSSFCEHNREKNQCKECGGPSICEHDKIRTRCKQCGDPHKITIYRWIGDSRRSDKKYDRYDADHFIDRCFLEGLIEDCKDECHYCSIPIQFIEYGKDLASIERLDNVIGHTKSNCVIACLGCNKSHQTTH